MTDKKVFVEYTDLAISEYQQMDVMSWDAFCDLSLDPLCTVHFCCFADDPRVNVE